MPPLSDIITEMRGPALIITFNRPDHGNALTTDMAGQLFNVIKPITTDRGVRAVILRGKGGNFMSGLEMRTYAGDLNRALEGVTQLNLSYNSVIRELQAMEKPVIAAVEGNVGGPGLSFMMACDLVMASRSTKFNTQFTSYALPPDGGSSFFLTRKVGAAKACELLMLGETFGAEQAEKWGLVNWVVDDTKLHDDCMALVDKLVAGPTKAYGAVKMLVGKAFEQNLHTHLGLEHTYWGAASRSFDFREAIAAYFAKRPGKYSGA